MSTVKITWPQFGRTLVVAKGTSILDAALDNDIPLEHACGGYCACTTCHIIVKEGAEHIAPMQEDEDDRLDSRADRTERSRLGCQSKVIGDVVVEIPTFEA